MLVIQTKCGNIANEILNAAIDTERTFKCKWPNSQLAARGGLDNVAYKSMTKSSAMIFHVTTVYIKLWQNLKDVKI